MLGVSTDSVAEILYKPTNWPLYSTAFSLDEAVMITRPRGATSKASAFFVGAIVAACPPAISDTFTSTIDRSLEECASNRKEDATGWQRLQLVLASRSDWVEMCAKQIQSDLRVAADRDYDSGTLTDQSFRRQRDEIDKYISNHKAAGIAGSEYNDQSVEQFVVVEGNGREQRSGEASEDPRVETLTGYKTISK